MAGTVHAHSLPLTKSVLMSRAAASSATPAAAAARRSVLLTGIILGVGVIGALDEAIFHQVLQWHTLLWTDDEHQRILSDGVFHLIALALLVYGAVRLWQTSSILQGRRDALIAATLIGAGAFNLYDGLVQHGLLHLHLVNEYVCANPTANNSLASCPSDVPYELAWLAVATGLLLLGVFRWRNAVAVESSYGNHSRSTYPS